MHFIKKVNGQLVGGPWPLTDDRTASPNTAWKAEQLALHGYELVADPAVEPTVEELIAKKSREIALEALKVDGILDSDAKITPAGKAIIEINKETK